MEGKGTLSSVDRISTLPDSVLSHILSLLPSKDSVKTCILGRRWRFLWNEVPTWDFDEHDFNCSRSCVSYADIISRFLMLHRVPNITSFCVRLKYSNKYDVKSWIFAAIARNVQNIYMSFDRYDSVNLPRCLFTCKTLVSLSILKGCRIHMDIVYEPPLKCSGIPMDGTVYLPLLKKLCLYYFEFESDESLPHLLSGCPVLEELAIRAIRNLRCCRISSPTIQVLTIAYNEKEYVGHRGYIRDKCTLEINAPALRYLKIDAFLALHISAETLNSLTKADILLHTSKLPEEYTIIPLLNSLSNVKHLTFKIDRTMFDDMALINSKLGSSALRFNTLTKLKLRADWFFLMKFLEAADNLEVLILHEVGDDQVISWKKPQIVPMCLISHLTTVVIYRFPSIKQDFEMIRYLLMNANVLKSMKIPRKAIERVSRFPRGSEVCELSFV